MFSHRQTTNPRPHSPTFPLDPSGPASTSWLDEIDQHPSTSDDSPFPSSSHSTFWPSPRVGLMVNRIDDDQPQASSSTATYTSSSSSRSTGLSASASSSVAGFVASSSNGAAYTFPDIHVRPHGAHVHSPDVGPEEHEYEALPLGAGWAVNMAAGAMVRFLRALWRGANVCRLGSVNIPSFSP